MGADSVNKIIDNICNKLSTTSELLVPEFAKMKFTGHMIWGIVFLILAVIMFIAFIMFMKSDTFYDDDIAFVMALIAIVLFFLCVWNITAAIQWNIAPFAKLTEYIIGEI